MCKGKQTTFVGRVNEPLISNKKMAIPDRLPVLVLGKLNIFLDMFMAVVCCCGLMGFGVDTSTIGDEDESLQLSSGIVVVAALWMKTESSDVTSSRICTRIAYKNKKAF